MRRFSLIILLGLLATVSAACSGAAEAGITPAPDKLTFLFFYTDNWAPWMAMEPVVNGLEETYQDQIEFRAIDAKSSEGQRAFRAYALPGHPGFVLLDPAGEVLWKGFGEQSRENIEINLHPALSE